MASILRQAPPASLGWIPSSIVAIGGGNYAKFWEVLSGLESVGWGELRAAEGLTVLRGRRCFSFPRTPNLTERWAGAVRVLREYPLLAWCVMNGAPCFSGDEKGKGTLVCCEPVASVSHPSAKGAYG